MGQTRQELKFIFITGLLVVLMGAGALRSFQLDMPVEEQKVAASELPAMDVVRAPSSIAESSLVIKPNLSRLEKELVEFDLNCKDGKIVPAHIQSKAETLQFSGKNCLGSNASDLVEVTNQTNGYTGSIFPMLNGRFETDFMQLAAGDNLLKIKIGNMHYEVIVTSRR